MKHTYCLRSLGQHILGLVFILSCERQADSTRGGSHAAAAFETADNQAASRSDAVRIAGDWLSAMRSRDRAKLQTLADVPFELQELVQYPKCETKRAEKREDVVAALDCLLSDDLLMEELGKQPAPVTEAIGIADLPPWAATQKDRIEPGQLVQIRLPGDGVSYQLLLLTAKASVKRVWKFAEYDSN